VLFRNLGTGPWEVIMKLSRGAIWVLWIVCVLILIALGTFAWPNFALPAPPPTPHEAQLVAIASDLSSITVETTPAGRAAEDAAAAENAAQTRGKTAAAATGAAAKANAATARKSGPPGSVSVIPATGTDPAAQALHAQLQARTLAPRDLLSIENGATQPYVSVETLPIRAWRRLLTLLCAALVVLTFGRAALGEDFGKLVVGLDGRISNSKTQLAIWFVTVMATYLATLWLRFCASGNLLLGAITIPSNLLLLSGMSVFSFAGAKAITQGKQAALAAAGRTDDMKAPADHASLSDLVQDDYHNADFGDTQMLFVTLIAAITYLTQVFIYLGAIDLHSTVTLPDVDTTLLATFGLGQGAYLAKKAASGPTTQPPPAPPPNGQAGAAGGAAAPPAPAPPPAPAAAPDPGVPPAPAATAAGGAPAGAAAVPPQPVPRPRKLRLGAEA
jgi:hypothetical protein